MARMCGLKVHRGRAFDGVMAPCARDEVWGENGERGRPHYWNTDGALEGDCGGVSGGCFEDGQVGVCESGRRGTMERAAQAYWLSQERQCGGEVAGWRALRYAAGALAAILRVHANASLSCQVKAWQDRLLLETEVGGNPPLWRLGKVRFG